LLCGTQPATAGSLCFFPCADSNHKDIKILCVSQTENMIRGNKSAGVETIDITGNVGEEEEAWI
jgi:hypothetical protein